MPAGCHLWFIRTFSALSVEPLNGALAFFPAIQALNDLMTSFGVSLGPPEAFILGVMNQKKGRPQTVFPQVSELHETPTGLRTQFTVIFLWSGCGFAVEPFRERKAFLPSGSGLRNDTIIARPLQKRRNSQSTQRPRCLVGVSGIRSSWTILRMSASWRRTSLRRRVVMGTRTARRAGIRYR